MEKQKTINYRNIYNNEDSGKVFLICLIAPILLSFILSMIANTIASAYKVPTDDITSSTNYVVAQVLFQAAMYIGTFLLYNKISKVSFEAINLKFKMPWKTYLIAIVIGIVAIFGINYFIVSTDNLLELIGFPVEDDILISSFGEYILSVFTMTLIPAFCEELLFRGVILHGLRSRFADWGAILLSGLMFALMHTNLQQFVYPFILGSIMGWLVLRTGSLVSSMIVHFVNNLTVVTLSYIENVTGFSLDLPNTWWFYLLAFGLLALTLGIIFIIDKFYFKRKSAVPHERTSKKTSLYVYVGLGISVFMLMVVTIIGFVSKGL